MWAYLANSLAWSGLGLLFGAALAELGWDLGSLISGRRKKRDDS